MVPKNSSNKMLLIFLFASALQRLIPFLVLPMFTAVLGPSGYGLTSTLVSVYVLAGVIFGLGQEVMLFRHGPGYIASKSPDVEKFRMSGAIIFLAPFFGFSVIIVALLFPGMQVFGLTGLQLGLTVLGSALAASGWQFMGSVFRIEKREVRYACHAISNVLIFTATKLLFVSVLDMGVLGWAVADAVGGALVFIKSLPTYRRILQKFDVGTSREFLSHVMWQGLSVVPSKASQWVSGLSDRIIVIAMLGAVAAGNYALATQLVSVGAIFIAEISRYVLPNLNQEADKIGRYIFIRSLAERQIWFISLIVVASLIVVEAVPLIFGEDFKKVVLLCSLLCFSLLTTGVVYFLTDVLNVTFGETRLVSIIGVSSALMSVGLNFALIPFLGLYGAILALTSSSILASCLLYILVRRRLGKHIWSGSVVGYLLVTSIGIACVYLVRVMSDVWYLSVGAGLSAGLVLIIIKVCDPRSIGDLFVGLRPSKGKAIP